MRPLRHAVLRPDGPQSSPRTQPTTTRTRRTSPLAPRAPGATAPTRLSVGTVLHEAPPWEPDRTDGWRVRGMATRPDARRRGLGGLVLDALLDHVASHGGGLVWCNARVPAQQLYGRAGFVTRGEVFELPGIGPHLLMWRTVDSTAHPAPPS